MPKAYDQLRAARLRFESRTTPGEPMSRDELAYLVNAEVYRATGKTVAVDANHIGKWERGTIRWPAVDYRTALRSILSAATDADLGFQRPRLLNSRTITDEAPDVARTATLGGRSARFAQLVVKSRTIA